MTIERKVVTGLGVQVVDVTGGWGFARFEKYDDSPITISLVGNGGYSKDFADDDRIIIPSSITALNVNAPAGRSWKLYMQKTVPAINQSELQFSITQDHKLIISGDDDIAFIGEPTQASADISGIIDNLENLSKLYMTASATKTVTDCARYCKLKAAVLLRYAN
jgi:hypothetical protein